MKQIFFLLVIILGINRPAFCHPADHPCEPGQITEQGCQEITPGLGLDNPAFFEAHRQYWHCRRTLVTEETVDYAICVGAVQEMEAQLGLPVEEGSQTVLGYWNLIPAHPELDRPGDPSRAYGQLDACNATKVVFNWYKYACAARRAELSAQLSAAVNKPAPVCPPRKPPRR